MMVVRQRESPVSSHRGAEFERRLVSCLQAEPLGLETFCQLAAVVASRDIPTAAIDLNAPRPRLLINPDFVDQHCRSDEHLFLLVFHELAHVLLGHTRLFPLTTPAHNIAFDAVINAGLARRFLPRVEYRGFFERLNPHNMFPGLLLRPPLGWPDHPSYPKDIGPPGTDWVLSGLYPPPDADMPLPFYEDILALLRTHGDQNPGGDLSDGPTLLGDHRHAYAPGHSQASQSRSSQEAIAQVASHWAHDTLTFGEPGSGGALADVLVALEPPAREARRAFARALRRNLNPRHGSQFPAKRMPTPGVSGVGVLPNYRDRTAVARQLLGLPPTLWAQPGFVNTRAPQQPHQAFVYLDVSASMADLLPHLIDLIVPYVRRGQILAFQFSTTVQEISLQDLTQGKISSSGGTDLDCVFQHIEQHPALRNVILLTDGETGNLDPAWTHLADRVRLHVILPSEARQPTPLQHIAFSITVLPPILT